MGSIPVNMATALQWRPSLALGDGTNRFLNWLWVWIVLANIGFAALWFSGAPPRHFDIVVIALVGLVMKRAPFWLRYLAFIGALTWTALNFLGGLFNLGPSSLLYSLQFFAEIKPTNALEYVAAGGALLIILFMAFRLLKRDANFASPISILAAAGLALGVAAVDWHFGRDMRGHYFRAAPAGANFGSATQRSGIIARADGQRHIMVVMVEALGVPQNNPELSRLLFRRYKQDPSVAARFEISEGNAPYYNSTTAGEIRELCGRWGDYYDLIDKKDEGCLPAKLARQGYSAEAVHSFKGSFFKRADWYPNIGFEKTTFAQELINAGARNCGGVFPGACDRDVPKMLSERLKSAKKPTLLYWLTLNSHLPVPPGLNLNVDNCERVSLLLKAEFPQICRQFAIYDDVDAALVKEITAADFPETDILIVGDHMPPYFDRHHRTQFDPAHVPWLYLKHKKGASAHSATE
jgi:Sulfatase